MDAEHQQSSWEDSRFHGNDDRWMFFNEPKCRVRMEVEILYPASERDKDCNEQPETRPKNQWFGKDANNKQKA